jgi:type II secretory pathway pseudopilin PulG
MSRRRSTRLRSRGGLTLLEVILALGILALALAILGELVRIGVRASHAAQDATHAQLLCESIVAELVVGAVPPDPVAAAHVASDPEWLYSIELLPTGQEGLVALRVTVVKYLDTLRQPPSFTLTRWIPDPDGLLAQQTREAQDAAASAGQTGAAAPATGG